MQKGGLTNIRTQVKNSKDKRCSEEKEKEEVTGPFLIDPQGPQEKKLRIQKCLNYEAFIARLRGGIGTNDFSVRFDLDPNGKGLAPWFHVRVGDLYLINVNATATNSGLGETGWNTDLETVMKNYPTNDFMVSTGSIGSALAALQHGSASKSQIAIAAFIISEAARFDVVKNAVKAVLRPSPSLTEVPWLPLRILLTNWQNSSQKLGNENGIAGITMEQSKYFFSSKDGGFEGTDTNRNGVLTFIKTLESLGF